MRLIDADYLTADISSMRVYVGGKDITDPEYRESVLTAIAEAPTVDVVVHGEWIDCSDGNATCSVCRTRQRDVYDDDNEQRFCGACGADMRR